MASGINDDVRTILNILVLGKPDSGKSRTGNSILGDKNAFVFGEPTENYKAIKRERFGEYVNVIDTPSDATLCSEKLRDISLSIEKDETCNSFPICVICVPIGRFSNEDLQMYNKYIECFDENLLNFTIIVFTHYDKWLNDMKDRGIPNTNFKCYIENLSDQSKALLHRCGDRFVTFNNRNQLEGNDNDEQVISLLTLANEMRKTWSKQTMNWKKVSDFFISAADYTKIASSSLCAKFCSWFRRPTETKDTTPKDNCQEMTSLIKNL